MTSMTSTQNTSPVGAEPRPISPNPEVLERAHRRHFSAGEKLRILREADGCSSTSGAIGALLRREGIYSSHLTTWRRQREQGELEALQPRRRGRPPGDPATAELVRLRLEHERLTQQLATAETIIEIQKKVAGLLGTTLVSSPRTEQP